MGSNAELPPLTRLVSYAYARADKNSHAHFRRGELTKLLRLKNRQATNRLIARAERDGWLRKDSGSECLLVPEHITDHAYPPSLCPRGNEHDDDVIGK
jgi:hypothetical protein